MASFYGFDGQLTEERFSQLSRLMSGLDVTVGSVDAWRASAVASQDRTVSVAPGAGWGYGITIESTTVETVKFDPVSSGSRYDLVAWRLDWAPHGGTVQLVAVQGSAIDTVPAPSQRPGSGVAYVPIATFRVTAGMQSPTLAKDLRQWGSQHIVVGSTAAIRNPRHGQLVTLSGTDRLIRWDSTARGWQEVNPDHLAFWAGQPASSGLALSRTMWTYPNLIQTDRCGTVTAPQDTRGHRFDAPGAGLYAVTAHLIATSAETRFALGVGATGGVPTTFIASPVAADRTIFAHSGSTVIVNVDRPTTLAVGWQGSGLVNVVGSFVQLVRIGDR